MSRDQPGQTIAGRYRVIATVGSGASSTVYQAIDVVTDRTVALKVLRASSDESPERYRFNREARAAARLHHLNLVNVLEFGESEGTTYLVMDFVEGGSLRDVLAGGKVITLEQALPIVRQVGAALSYLHGRGLVHRDLKPSNILLRPDGRVLLGDLGLWLRSGSGTLTFDGTVLGTPTYMSPEQVIGRSVDARSDIFAFGVVTYEMLTGRRPFLARGFELFQQIANEPATSPERVNPRITTSVAAALLRALAKSPDERYETADAFVEALQRAADVDQPLAAAETDSQVSPLSEQSSEFLDEPTGVSLPLGELPWPLTPTLSRGSVPAWILVVTGPLRGKQFPLGEQVTIGRASAHADIALEDRSVSRRHAQIERRADGFYVIDLDSTNGVLVNGARVETHLLTDRDEIEIGYVILTFIEAVTGPKLAATAKRHLREFESVWHGITEAAVNGNVRQFEAECERLVAGVLREAVGYRIEDRVPSFRGISGFVLNSPMMWISHSRFPILFMDYEVRRPEVLADVMKQLEMAKVGGYFALLVVVPRGAATGDEAATLRRDLSDSVYRYDIVVLDRHDLASVVTHGSSQRLVAIILEQGIELSSLSPYVVRGPVPEQMFFGRERELKAISQTIESHSYAVVGGRRIGKSSTLLKLNRILQYDPRLAPLYMNCEDKLDTSEFLSGLAEALERSAGMSDWHDLRTVLMDWRKQVSSRLPVFLLDEVDELLAHDADSKPSGQLFKTLRALSHEGLCRVVLSGSRTLHALLHDPRSPLFNFCTEMPLQMLDSRSVAEIVAKPLEQLGFDLLDRDALVDRVMAATGGHPNLVQWLCDRLVKNERGRRVDVGSVEAVISDPAFGAHFIETAWGDATPFERLVSLIPPEPDFQLEDLLAPMKQLGLDDRPRIVDALDTLELFALVQRTGTRYRFLLREFGRIVRETSDVRAQITELARELKT